MVPWPSPTNADRRHLQPTYDKVNAAVRAVDQEVLLFIAGVTWGDLGSGFSAAPGGPEYGNRTVVTYHFYQPPQGTSTDQVSHHAAEAVRLGTAAMLTETESLWSGDVTKKGERNFTDACDAQLQGWADWGWKSFNREARDDPDPVSQYGAWGSPKTGHGLDWNGTEPPSYYFTALARTYAPRVVGSHIKMAFSAVTSEFELQYEVGSLQEGLASEVFLWPQRYPGGANVTVSTNVGAVRVEYDGEGSWVRLYPGEGLQLGALVTVHIASTSK